LGPPTPIGGDRARARSSSPMIAGRSTAPHGPSVGWVCPVGVRARRSEAARGEGEGAEAQKRNRETTLGPNRLAPAPPRHTVGTRDHRKRERGWGPRARRPPPGLEPSYEGFPSGGEIRGEGRSGGRRENSTRRFPLRSEGPDCGTTPPPPGTTRGEKEFFPGGRGRGAWGERVFYRFSASRAVLLFGRPSLARKPGLTRLGEGLPHRLGPPAVSRPGVPPWVPGGDGPGRPGPESTVFGGCRRPAGTPWFRGPCTPADRGAVE